ncbi:MAG: cyclic nucleotide-binding domain-containing protein [Treponema sp.]|uniref:Crp/Fnr family transcriptional regulator n=1 Tax=Treponema sp. TaxID=166 RepID=UPI001B3ED54B|nr:Crp/Fnr family transcriptional regulator [Treponema sp.]MBP5587442.1 cyclic nucleotide-binding domain-containing protein [Treponema sp.]MCR5386257.1 cyclic nucleotide-binding domain-containing protein [Treponema sp.]
MPKAVQYTKGSIIYFAGDRDERIYILQKGLVILTSTDIETGAPVTEQVKTGEFFGVKSSLGHFPREETATVLQDTIAITMSLQEFETIFSSNKEVILKMLRVFSGQLRQIHKKTESILKQKVNENQADGMFSVAKSFYQDEQYRACCDVCIKYLTNYPTAPDKDSVAKIYADAKLRADKLKNRRPVAATPASAEGALKQFSLPAFDRFAKKYEPEQVIISEFEPGNSFYLIQSGEVQLVKCVNGTKKNLDILKPGEFFGEMAILDNSPRSATCMAIGPVECLEFNKENFALLITGNPQLALILLKLFCKRIYDQKRRLRILTIKDLPARIADVFLMYDEMNPVGNPIEHTRKFNVTVADIAHWAGLTPEVTRDEINKYVEKRKLEVYDNYMIVTNIADMKRTVDSKLSLN